MENPQQNAQAGAIGEQLAQIMGMLRTMDANIGTVRGEVSQLRVDVATVQGMAQNLDGRTQRLEQVTETEMNVRGHERERERNDRGRSSIALGKPVFPTFAGYSHGDGKKDAREYEHAELFFKKLETTFQLHGITDEQQKIAAVATNLRGIAEVWYQLRYPMNMPGSYAELKNGLKEKYPASLVESRIRDELDKLTMKAGQLTKYNQSFLRLNMFLTDCAVSDQISFVRYRVAEVDAGVRFGEEAEYVGGSYRTCGS